ncbi:YafY family protein [Cellulomonas sp. PhB143]|uniref:helix-turn-helix transcriptional regulator n=1 Tax=Cellulomonas sp. PhB143 TaxID=2485186 RepID=UPI000F48FDBB|nr:YafY family protein [Cellulomonas sp. PhB143]ROS78923.1 HTH domain-containing protein [Cellulomonas sp. PhB143]
MNRTDRLYAIVEELRAVAPRPRSARRLAERFEVSARTIERDLAALQQSGVPIWAETGRTGGYCLDPSHTLPPLGFTVEETLAVAIALGTLATSPFREPAASALRKVLAVTDERRLEVTSELAARVHLLDDDSAGTAPDGFAGALRTRGVLRLRYRDRNGTETSREVEPLGFVGRGQHWYLVAWCRARDAVRVFRSDRIVALEPTGEQSPHRSFRAEDLDIPYGDLRPVSAAG